MLTLFIVPAASFVNILPTPVDPVKLIFLTLGLVASSNDASRFFVGTRAMTSFGMPACSASFVRAAAVKGVSLGGLITTAQPAANAGAILRVIIAAGKFHGVMMPHTPTGSLKVNTTDLAYELGMLSP